MFDAPGSGAGTVLLPELDPITLTPTAGLNLSTGSESASFPRSRGRATSPSADDAAPLPRSGLDVTSPVVLAVMGVSIVLLAAAGWYALRRN